MANPGTSPITCRMLFILILLLIPRTTFLSAQENNSGISILKSENSIVPDKHLAVWLCSQGYSLAKNSALEHHPVLFSSDIGNRNLKVQMNNPDHNLIKIVICNAENKVLITKYYRCRDYIRINIKKIPDQDLKVFVYHSEKGPLIASQEIKSDRI